MEILCQSITNMEDIDIDIHIHLLHPTDHIHDIESDEPFIPEHTLLEVEIAIEKFKSTRIQLLAKFL